jgi:Tfp pilus assembly protein PilP
MAGGPVPYNRRNPAERAALAEIIFDLKAQGLSNYSIDQITQHPDGPTGGVRVPASTVRDLIREETGRRVDPKVDEYRTLELARLEATLERLHNMEESVQRVMGRKHITVNNGRVIRVENPETGEEEPVEDDTFVLQAVDRLNRIEESRRRTSESIRRLLGLDMPAKVDHTVTETTQQDIELQEMIRDAKAKVRLEEQQIVDGSAEG